MKKFDALGVIETQYYTVALEILDSVCKAAEIEYLASERYLGGRLVTLIIGGGVSDIDAALEKAKDIGSKKLNQPLKMAIMITNPHPEILKYVLPSKEKQPLNKLSSADAQENVLEEVSQETNQQLKHHNEEEK